MHYVALQINTMHPNNEFNLVVVPYLDECGETPCKMLVLQCFYLEIVFDWWTRQRIHCTPTLVDLYLWLMGENDSILGRPGPVFCLLLGVSSGCDWPSIDWAYSEQETENRPRSGIILSTNGVNLPDQGVVDPYTITRELATIVGFSKTSGESDTSFTRAVYCFLLGVSSDYAQPITGQVAEVTCPVIGRAQPELALSKRLKMGPGSSMHNQSHSSQSRLTTATVSSMGYLRFSPKTYKVCNSYQTSFQYEEIWSHNCTHYTSLASTQIPDCIQDTGGHFQRTS